MKIDISALDRLDRRKGERLKTVLEMSDSINDFVPRDAPCQFNTTTDEYNPASIYDPQFVNPKGSLLIEIAEWFYRTYSAGYIVGMLCHEVGAHYMATNALRTHPKSQLRGLEERPMTLARLDLERNHMNSEERITEGGYEVRDEATTWTFTPLEAKQPDHIYATCYGYARYDYYRRLLIELAQIIAIDRRGDPDSFTADDLPDLIDCWLMDVSSILATKDKRGAGPFVAGYMSDAYNAHLRRLQADVNGLTTDVDVRHAVANARTKSGAGVFSAYAAMVPRLFK